ncbi:MAG: DUF3147 family protein [Bacteriovoracaceae bacterium]|nr:DUF3147 family protein [Bacteriovoracaceae bacterium]
MYLVIKVVITALLVVGISEIGKRLSFAGGVLASLPLTSILAFVWMNHESANVKEIIDLSYVIFWMVVPSLFFFLALPFFLKLGWKFYPALLTSSVLMFGVYTGYSLLLSKFGVKL